MKRVAVLISGSGSNLQAILDWQRTRRSACGYEVVGVLSNRPDTYGLIRAEKAGIPATTLDHTRFASREAFDAELVQVVEAWQPDIVALAGFMRILTPVFTDHFLGRAVNIHPSLLPKYRGLHTHRRVLEAGDREHGLSIHFVTSELDGGPLIYQQAIPVRAEDTEHTLKARVHTEEHKAYPRVIEALARERITFENGAALCYAENCHLPVDLEHLNALLGLAE